MNTKYYLVFITEKVYGIPRRWFHSRHPSKDAAKATANHYLMQPAHIGHIADIIPPEDSGERTVKMLNKITVVTV